jgi:hypothetical protein
MKLESALVSGVAAALVSTMCLAADAPAVPIPTSPGAAGSVIARGKTITIVHVQAIAIPDPTFPGRDRVVLFLSDRPLVIPASAWETPGSVEFEGILLAVSENGKVSFLRVKQGDLDFGFSGQKVDAFEWAGGVVKGQETDYGDNEGDRISYGIAFNAPITRAPAAQKAPAKKR